jgi:hypothetical protein
MKRTLFVFICILGVTLALSGCVTTTGSESSTENQTATMPAKISKAGPQSHTVGVGAGGFNEYCEDEWKVGDKIKVSFTSTKPVVFNVHFHDDKQVKHYPIKDILADDFSANFTVQNEYIHCGLWQNNTDSFVKLTYEIVEVE